MTPIPDDHLEVASRWLRVGARRWQGHIAPGWLQGRGAFGGLQAAVALRAMTRLVATGRPARTLTIHFIAPLHPGPAEVEARVLRAGASITHASASLSSPVGPCAMALATFGRGRPAGLELAGGRAPRLRPPRAVRPDPGPGIPAFIQHIDLDIVEGAPYSGAPLDHTCGWVRFRRQPEPSAWLLAALADVWPPVALARSTRPHPSASVDLTLQFLSWPPTGSVPPDAFYSFYAETLTAGEGYTEEHGTLFWPDGSAAVRVRQLRAIYPARH